MDNGQNNSLETNSLESSETTVTSAGQPQVTGPAAGAPKKGLVGWVKAHLNIYLLLFILILVIAGVAVFVSFQASKKNNASKDVKVSNLTDAQLKALQTSSTNVGDPKQVLNIESNAIFAGKVLIRDSLDVAGTIKVGGPLSLPGISVAGNSSFDEVKINNLTISGNTSIQGQLSVQKTLSVSGGATFGGTISAPQLNIDNLQINKDLVISHHIVPGGSTPAIATGTAVGGGGTATVNGSDTSGTITINTGNNPPIGCFATITFTQKFNNTPHIVVTPVGLSAASLEFYITRNTTTLAVCTATAAPASASFNFDYVAFD